MSLLLAVACHPNTCLSLERCYFEHLVLREEEPAGRGGLKSTLVYGSHWGILPTRGSLEAFITILKNQKYPGEECWAGCLLPTGQVSSDPVSRSESCVVDWWTRGCTKPWLLYATLLWQTLSTGLALGDVRANGDHLTRADHLNYYALWSSCSLFLVWKWGEKNIYWMWLLQCVTASYQSK